MVVLPVNTKAHWGAISVDFANQTVKGDNIELDVVIMDSLRRPMYEQDLISVFCPLQRYLALHTSSEPSGVQGPITGKWRFSGPRLHWAASNSFGTPLSPISQCPMC